MAKLLSYYRLCPLIDTKNLLGISEDSEKGVVIVTLGRNISIKYRLSDQKQICSWRSKEKFSSPVYYDKKLESYVALFNQSFIRVWTNEDESLDKVKKYKFNQPIHTVLTHNDQTFVVFKCGSLYPLNEILDTRKTFTPAAAAESLEICDIAYASLDEDLYFGFLAKNEEGLTFFWTMYSYYSKNVFSKNRLIMKDAELKGLVLFPSNKKVSLLTVWSDGKIYNKELIRHDKEQTDIGELFTVLENISAEHFIKLIPLDDKYIAIYGSDPNEEGAILLIYNTQFRLTQSKQIHKLYSDEAKIWKTYNFILLPVGQNLIAVPFCLESEQLVALIGSHKSAQAKIDSDIAFVTEFEVADWNQDSTDSNLKKQKKHKKAVEDVRKKGKQAPKSLKSKLEDLFKEGLPESLIVEQILPDILEDGSVQLLHDCLYFFTDIPEAFLARAIHFTLSSEKKKFSPPVEKSFKNLPDEVLPEARVTLLDKILIREYSDVLLLPYLRSHLSVDDALVLLKYLVYQLSEDGHNFPSFNALKTEKCIINWMSVIIDSNYQKFILSKDNNIEDTLVKCKSAIAEHLDIIDCLKVAAPVLSKLEAEAKGKSYANGRLANSLYSIEQIEF